MSGLVQLITVAALLAFLHWVIGININWTAVAIGMISGHILGHEQ